MIKLHLRNPLVTVELVEKGDAFNRFPTLGVTAFCVRVREEHPLSTPYRSLESLGICLTAQLSSEFALSTEYCQVARNILRMRRWHAAAKLGQIGKKKLSTTRIRANSVFSPLLNRSKEIQTVLEASLHKAGLVDFTCLIPLYGTGWKGEVCLVGGDYHEERRHFLYRSMLWSAGFSDPPEQWAENVDEFLRPKKQASRQGISSAVRIFVWRRDNGQCVRCGSREKLEFDHIIPFAKGGSDTARNIELLCQACNRTKAAHVV